VIRITGKAGKVVCYRKSKELLVLDAKTGAVLETTGNDTYSLIPDEGNFDSYGNPVISKKGEIYNIQRPEAVIFYKNNPVTSKRSSEDHCYWNSTSLDFISDGNPLGIIAFQDGEQSESFPHMVRKYSLYCFDASKNKFLWKFGNYCKYEKFIGLSSWWQEGSIFYGKSRVSYTRIDPVKGKMLHSEYGDYKPGVVTDGKYVCVLSCGDNDNIDSKPKKSKLSCYLLPEFK
jgi:hypothetical protein